LKWQTLFGALVKRQQATDQSLHLLLSGLCKKILDNVGFPNFKAAL
jgi:hypothetical protein